MTREITMIVVHCSATRCNHPYTVHQLYHDHVEVNHWRYIGYHFFISRDGKVHAIYTWRRQRIKYQLIDPKKF